MWLGTISTDFNGLVLFEPTRLARRYGSFLKEGTDLFTRFRTTEEGDEMLREGMVVPILAIDDAGYDVVVRRSDEPFTPPGKVVATNGVFPLKIEERLVLADLAVLKEWWAGVGWQDVPGYAGSYGVTVRGYRELNDQGHISVVGYEFVLNPEADLPQLTADTGRNMRVLDLA